MKFPNYTDANSKAMIKMMMNKRIVFHATLWLFCVTGFCDDEVITRKTKPNVFPFPDGPVYREVFNSSVILNTTDIVIGKIEQSIIADRFTSDIEQYGQGEFTIATIVVESFVGGENPGIEGEIAILNPIAPGRGSLAGSPESDRSIRFLRKLSEEEIEELKESLVISRQLAPPIEVIELVASDQNDFEVIGEIVVEPDHPSKQIPSDLWVWAKDGNDRRWSSQRLGENPGDPLPSPERHPWESRVMVIKPLGLTHFLERKAQVEPSETAMVSYLSDLMSWLQEIRSGSEEIDKETLDPLQKELYEKLQKRDP